MHSRTVLASAALLLAATVVGSVPAVAGAASAAGSTSSGLPDGCRELDVPVTAPAVRGRVHGTLCTPAGTARAVMVLVPGATYNSTYWDFPYQPETYSYRRAMVAAGYATFALDPLGTGRSSRPAAGLVTATVQAEAVHDVVQVLRKSFDRVLLTGHSLGSAVAILAAATHRDVDGLVVTGLQHRVNLVSTARLFTTDLHPALADPQLAGRGYNAAQLTTVPGRRYDAFHRPGEVDPEVVAVDEATKDAFTATEAPDAIGVAIVSPYSARVDVPVLIAMGERDANFCGFLAASCDREGVLATERPYYPHAPSVDAFVLPAAGHDVNLSPRAPQLHAAVVAWADRLRPGA